MIIGNIPELSEKFPEKPRKTTHETGEIFQMILDRKIKENEDERALAGRSGLPREAGGKV